MTELSVSQSKFLSDFCLTHTGTLIKRRTHCQVTTAYGLKFSDTKILMAVWPSGNVVDHINEAIRRARLVLRWATVRGISYRYATSHSDQLSLLFLADGK